MTPTVTKRNERTTGPAENLVPGCDAGRVSSPDNASPRRPLFAPVVVATAFLVMIGATAGALLGKHAARRDSAAEPARTPASVPSPALTDATPESPGPTGARSAPDTRATATPTSTVTAPASLIMPPVGGDYRDDRRCPAPMSRLAQNAGADPQQLHLALYIFTSDLLGVWVCGDGRRFYYLHQARKPEGRPIKNARALFLTDVREEALGYQARHVAADKTTIYTVSRAGLIITDNRGRYDVKEPRGD